MVLLEAKGITKKFPGVVALDKVDLKVESGKVHCIVGENGAGKSTLVKVIRGMYNAEEGFLVINDEEIDLRKQNIIDTISYVPQELNLFMNLSVAENLFVPFNRKEIYFNKRKYEVATNEYINKLQMVAKPSDIVKNISIADQQLLQVARALSNKKFKIIIMDEPTSSLTRIEIDRLFSVINSLKNEGKAVIFITHKLDEVFELGDVVTILRNGKLVGSAKIKEATLSWVIEKMIGEDIELSKLYHPTKPLGEKVLEVNNLSGINFKDISFYLREGEILGFAGLVGAGKTEIMLTIFGYLLAQSGDVKAIGKKWKFRDTSFSVENGVIYLPEERKTHGILPSLNVRENIGIILSKKISIAGVVSVRKDKKIANKVIKDYSIAARSSEMKIIYLSGGNQQKVLIGRAMEALPRILLLDEPTRGIDVKAKEEVYNLMKNIAEEGRVGIIFTCSELEELIRCSNRIITVYKGRKFCELGRNQINMENIVSSVIGIRNEVRKECKNEKNN